MYLSNFETLQKL